MTCGSYSVSEYTKHLLWLRYLAVHVQDMVYQPVCEIFEDSHKYQKIKRHKTHILNTIRYGMSNARIEATNNKIKLIIRKAYGFRNIQNMLDMVYLVCSDIRIPFPNRKLNAA